MFPCLGHDAKLINPAHLGKELESTNERLTDIKYNVLNIVVELKPILKRGDPPAAYNLNMLIRVAQRMDELYANKRALKPEVNPNDRRPKLRIIPLYARLILGRLPLDPSRVPGKEVLVVVALEVRGLDGL